MMKLRGLHKNLRPYAEEAVRWAREYGIDPTITSVYRSWENQARLRNNFERCVALGRYPWARECRYPANEPGDSAHNFGLAWDSWVPPEDQEAWDYIRRAIGFDVPQHDRIHAELPAWRQYVV